MRKNRISEFLESIDSEKWNCVYQINGMTLLTSKEYNYRYEEIVNLKIQLKKQKEAIDKANKKLNNFIDCCKAEKLESGSDYIHHQYWDMFERFNKQIKDILKEVSE